MPNMFTVILGSTTFVAVILSVLADLILAISWEKFYFTSGFLVFRQQVSIESRHSNTPSPSLLEKQLSSCWMGSFAFKELESNQYGFRQRFFSFTWNPVTHGLIMFDAESNQVTVKGYLNWFALSLTAFMLVIIPFLWLTNGITRTEFLSLFTTNVIGCGFIFGIPYLLDRSRLKMITETAAELWSRKHVRIDEKA